MALQLISLMVGTDHVVPINPMGGQAQVTVAAGAGTVYYADNSQVSASSNQGSINAGSSQTFTKLNYMIASQPGMACTVQVADGDSLSNLNWPYRL
jgi:hypothetical protein